MNRSRENDCFRRFQETREPRLLAKVFDSTAAELLRVASHLAGGDRELTQDALQATFLTAIEDADSYDVSRDVRPWLLGILANHVRKERRRSLRQRGQDVAALGLSAKDSPVADAQVAELDEAAMQSMQKLPSPFREAIVLHLQHGLTAVEISEALGRPAGTVRTQIVRGMDRLRALLPVGFGVAAVGVLLTPGPVLAAVRRDVLATLSAKAVGSSSLVLSGWRLYAMMMAGVLVVLSVLVPMSMSDDPAPVVPIVSSDASREGEGERREAAPSRELVEDVGAADVAAPQPVPQPARGNDVPVRFEVVYADGGKPAANVPIGMMIDGELRQWNTDASGVLRISLPYPGLYEARVLGTGARTHWSWPAFSRPPREQVQKMTIDAGLTLELDVVDAAGAPIADALVESSCGGRMVDQMHAMGRTDANGRLVRHHLEGGQLRVVAKGRLPSALIRIEGGAADVVRKTITLTGVGLHATGIVRDEGGIPIADARLALVQFRRHPTEPQFFTSDKHGRFVIDTLHKGRHVLVGEHRGDELRRGQLRFEHGGDGTLQLELRLTRGARIEGQLTDAAGNAVANTTVYARCRAEATNHLPFHEVSADTDAEGLFLFEGLAPSAYQLESENVDPKFVELRDGETMTWNPQVRASRDISVRLLDHEGKPLVGWWVSIMKPGTDWPWAYSCIDADGRLEAAPYLDWKFPEGQACRFAIHRAPVDPAAPNTKPRKTPSLITPPLLVGIEHEIRVPAHVMLLHSVEGVLVDEDGAAIEGATVTLSRDYGRWGEPEVVAGKDGSFRFDEVPPGRYRAWVTFAGQPALHLPDVDVRGSLTTSLGRIVAPKLGRIDVTVVGGADTAGLKLWLSDANGRTLRMRRQQDGSWRSGRVYFGDYELRGWTSSTWGVPKHVRLNRATVDVDFTLAAHQATTVTVELPFDHDRAQVGWSGKLQVLRDGRTICEHRLSRDYYGKYQSSMEFALPLPPGRVEVRVVGWNKRVGVAAMRVPDEGGGQLFVQIR